MPRPSSARRQAAANRHSLPTTGGDDGLEPPPDRDVIAQPEPEIKLGQTIAW